MSLFVCRCDAPDTSNMTMSLSLRMSMINDAMSDSSDMVSDDTSSLGTYFLCGLPSATVLPLILPHLFSLIQIYFLDILCFHDVLHER